MRELEYLGKILLAVGVFMAFIGLAIILLARLFKGSGFSLLPGDILIKKGDFTFFFPVATGLLLSLLLTIILNVVFWFLSRK